MFSSANLGRSLAACAAFFAATTELSAQVQPQQYGQQPVQQYAQQPAPQGGPNFRVAERADNTVSAAVPLSQQAAPILGSQGLRPAAANEHPLVPAFRWAKEGLPAIERINDYTATMVKRERVGTALGDEQYIALKVRHRPFSVYLNFLAPQAVKGQEVIFVAGQNDNKIQAHGVGMKKMFGTVSLEPTSNMAMSGQRYPITQIGVLNLTKRLAEVAEQDIQYGECDVKYFKGAKINNRICTCIQVVHPVPRKNFLFNIARIFVDDELNIPIRYEAYAWPKHPGEAPEKLEEYTYLNLKMNVGLTDADFDIHNPQYQFTSR
jgi:hypothetical protein